MDTTENKTEHFLKKNYPEFKPEKDGYYCAKHKGSSIFEAYYFADGEWYYTKAHADSINVPEHSLNPISNKIIEFLALSPPMEVKDAEAAYEKWLKENFKGNTAPMTWQEKVKYAYIAGCQSQLQPPVISAEDSKIKEFLIQLRTASPERIEDIRKKAQDLLTEFSQLQLPAISAPDFLKEIEDALRFSLNINTTNANTYESHIKQAVGLLYAIFNKQFSQRQGQKTVSENTEWLEKENERLQSRSNELDKALFHLDEVLNHAVSNGNTKHVTVVKAEEFMKSYREWRDSQRTQEKNAQNSPTETH